MPKTIAISIFVVSRVRNPVYQYPASDLVPKNTRPYEHDLFSKLLQNECVAAIANSASDTFLTKVKLFKTR